jgi:hypothetical protein
MIHPANAAYQYARQRADASGQIWDVPEVL